MGIPEQCPFCGADLEDDDYIALKRYQCGTELNAAMGVILVTCDAVFSGTSDAKAYRQRLLWRKRLSQHTGVPLRLIGDPARDYRTDATWAPDIWLTIGVGGKRSRLELIDSGLVGKAAKRDAARRRLLAREVGE